MTYNFVVTKSCPYPQIWYI